MFLIPLSYRRRRRRRRRRRVGLHTRANDVVHLLVCGNLVILQMEKRKKKER